MKQPRVEELRAMAEEVRAEVISITNEIKPLQLKLVAAKEQLDLIDRLLALAQTPGSKPARPPKRSTGNAPVAGTLDVEEAVTRILRQYGKPLHVTDLREQLVKEGVPLPGRGTEANVLVRLHRATDRFMRTGRGTYGLVEWGMPEVRPTRKVKRSRQSGREQ